MDPRLQKLADDVELRDHRRVREYHEALAEKGYPEKLLTGAARAEKLLTSNQKLAAKAAREYPLQGNEERPGYLRDAISDLHAHYLRPLRERLASLPQRLRERAGRIQAAKPADFRSYEPALMAKLDGEQCDSLMSELIWLEQFPEKVAAQQAYIAEWMNSPSGGGYQLPRVSPAPEFLSKQVPSSDDDGPPDRWDPRA